jgi:multicomponent Na+:H+ antiporter subunit E
VNVLALTGWMSFLWALATGDFTLANFLLGFGVSFSVLLFLSRMEIRRVRAGFILGAYFLWELLLANLRVAYEVVTPELHIRSGIIGIPLDIQTDTQITLLASLLALTPGSISLDISPDRKILYIHTMYVDDPDVLRKQIKNGFERLILEAFG